MLALCIVICVLLLCVILSNWAPYTCLSLLSMIDHVLEPERDVVTPHRATMQKQIHMQTTGKRGYISPYTKKLVASQQGWKCAICGALLRADYEIDHITPLFRGGANDVLNLQALCRSPCHIQKSARERMA